MENLFSYIIGLDQNILLVILIAIFYSLERLLGSPHVYSKRVPHFLNNLVFQIFFFGINIIIAALQVGLLKWTNAQQFGLFHLISVPFWLQVVIAIVALDLSSYIVHRISHRAPILWRLHRVHHSDSNLDTSSFFRGHPLEAFTFGTGFVVTAMLLGLNLDAFVFYFIVVLPFLIMQHCNIQTPLWIDQTFGKIFTTPNLHKIHHHREQQFTDSNYADILILWDKMFGTYQYVPVKDIEYGLKEFDGAQKQTWWYLLISPFISMRREK